MAERRSKNITGERIAQARAKSTPPMTQADLAKAVCKHGAKIDRAGIAKIETGIRGVGDFELVALAKALAVSMTWLLRGKCR